MSQPVQNLRHTRQFGPLRKGRTVDHQHRQAQRPRGIQLGACSGAARVLGHDQFDAMLLHQRAVVGLGERPTRDNHVAMRQRQAIRFIDKPQQIVVLGLGGKILKVHPTHGQKDALGRAGQGGNGGLNVGNVMPAITLLRAPNRAGQRSQRYFGLTAGRNGVPAHLGCKGMSGIDNMRNRIVFQKACQPFGAAKPSDAHWQGLRARGFNAPGVGIGRRNTLFGHGFGQRVSLGRAAKDQEVGHA